MPRKTPYDQIFTIRLPNALAEEVRDRARETGRPVGNFIRHALRQVLAGRVPEPLAASPVTRQAAEGAGTARLFGGAAQPTNPRLEE